MEHICCSEGFRSQEQKSLVMTCETFWARKGTFEKFSTVVVPLQNGLLVSTVKTHNLRVFCLLKGNTGWSQGSALKKKKKELSFHVLCVRLDARVFGLLCLSLSRSLSFRSHKKSVVSCWMSASCHGRTSSRTHLARSQSVSSVFRKERNMAGANLKRNDSRGLSWLKVCLPVVVDESTQLKRR